MIPLAWDWLRKNVNLVLLLAATTCLALALGGVIRGATWSLLMPVSLSAVVCGWGVGTSRLTPKQAWASLTALGIPGVFIYVGGLIRPLGRLIVSALSLIPQLVLWVHDRALIDVGPLLVAWIDATNHAASVLGRLWEWWAALLIRKPIVDPFAAGLVWNMLLWLIGAWAGWQLRRNRQALKALAPGAVMLALVLDYTRGEVALVIVYLALLLALIGLARNEWMHVQWQQRKIDYAESIAIDTMPMVGLVTTFLILSAIVIPSLSWRDLVDRLREWDRGDGDHVAESLGLEVPPNVANNKAYRSDGLPRSHLLDMPPELLQEVVMTVSTGELSPIPLTALTVRAASSGDTPVRDGRTGPNTVIEIQPNRYYWRAITYDVYSGVGWSSSSAQDVLLPAHTPLMALPQDYRLLTQHVRRTPAQSNSVYWTGILAQADVDIDIAWRTRPPSDPDPVHNGDMLGALTDLDEYTVISYVPQFRMPKLRAAGSDYPPEIARRYLGLPASTPERVLALARELTLAAPTPYDRAAAIEAYLRTFPYTLEVEPAPPGCDVVDYFLFTAQQGYCDYYATSMVVLARAVGLPARVVIGYASGEYNAPTAEYIVRQKDAHTWAEIYFSGIGWVEFEPTASQPAIIRVGDESASGPPPHLPVGQSAMAWLKIQWRGLVSKLGGQFIIAGVGLVLLFTLWQIVEMWYLHLIPSQKAIQHIYFRMEKVSTYLLPELPGGHTPYQLQIALTGTLRKTGKRIFRVVFSPADAEIERLAAIYMAQVFSKHPPTKSQTSQGIRTWMRLRWRLWISVGCRHRQY